MCHTAAVSLSVELLMSTTLVMPGFSIQDCPVIQRTTAELIVRIISHCGNKQNYTLNCLIYTSPTTQTKLLRDHECSVMWCDGFSSANTHLHHRYLTIPSTFWKSKDRKWLFVSVRFSKPSVVYSFTHHYHSIGRMPQVWLRRLSYSIFHWVGCRQSVRSKLIPFHSDPLWHQL